MPSLVLPRKRIGNQWWVSHFKCHSWHVMKNNREYRMAWDLKFKKTTAFSQPANVILFFSIPTTLWHIISQPWKSVLKVWHGKIHTNTTTAEERGEKKGIKDHFVLKASHTNISVFLPSFARAYSHKMWHIQVMALLPALWNRVSADSYVIVKAFFSLAPFHLTVLCNSLLLLQMSPKFRIPSSPC